MNRRVVIDVTIIVVIWFFAYSLTQYFLDPLYGWDDTQYTMVANGIVRDGDISARTYTVMGLLRDGYPTHFVNLPVYPILLAPFWYVSEGTLIGVYLISWLAGLGTMLFMYAAARRFMADSPYAPVLIGVSYLAIPGVLRNLDTALMEPTGAFLLSAAFYALIRLTERGRWTLKTLAAIAGVTALLFMYKTIFVGVVFGAAAAVALFLHFHKADYAGLLRRPLAAAALTLVLFAAIYSFVPRALFYPVSRSFVYDPTQQGEQLYAEPLGGLLLDFPSNVIRNAKHFFLGAMSQHIVYRAKPTPYLVSFLYYERYLYFLLVASLAAAAFLWKKFPERERIILAASGAAILSFLFILNVIIRNVPDNLHRYSMYYLPIVVLSLVLVWRTLWREMAVESLRARKALAAALFLFVGWFYFPLAATMGWHQIVLARWYEEYGKSNTDFMRPYLSEHRPAFFYSSIGSYAPIEFYPSRQVILQATEEQFLALNEILPEPVGVLFLRASDWLFEAHADEIQKKKPLFGGRYLYAGEYLQPPRAEGDESLPIAVYILTPEAAPRN